jgi:hypothetical protein
MRGRTRHGHGSQDVTGRLLAMPSEPVRGIGATAFVVETAELTRQVVVSHLVMVGSAALEGEQLRGLQVVWAVAPQLVGVMVFVIAAILVVSPSPRRTGSKRLVAALLLGVAVVNFAILARYTADFLPHAGENLYRGALHLIAVTVLLAGGIVAGRVGLALLVHSNDTESLSDVADIHGEVPANTTTIGRFDD